MTTQKRAEGNGGIGTSSRHTPNGRPNKAERSRKKSKKKQMNGMSYVMMAAALLFIVCLLILIQHNIISSLDNQVRNLESTLSEQQSLNDSKEGQLISSRNLETVETAARGYGMTEPQADQYVYVVTQPKTNANDQSNVVIKWWNEHINK